MSISWFSSDSKTKNCIATIYDSNITLNKFTCDLISNAYTVMLGLDYDERVIYIKPLRKDIATRGDIPQNKQYAITLRASYGRISNVDFIKEIKNLLKVPSLKDTPKKFNVEWSPYGETLKIDLNEEVI